MPDATRFLTFSFDDGFRASTEKTAALFEEFELRAEFHVVTAFGERDPARFGDWALWNALSARGHSIQPHGYDHTNKAEVPLAVAQDSIRRCLDSFAENLHGFDAEKSIFGFPYLASTPELEAWLPGVVRAFRTSGETLNPLPTRATTKLTTGAWPDAELRLDRCVDELLARDSGWLIYCAHGLDGEGWGPLRSEYLKALLERLTQAPNRELLPARDVLRRFDATPQGEAARP